MCLRFFRSCICLRGLFRVTTSGFECRHNVDLHNKQCLDEKSLPHSRDMCCHCCGAQMKMKPVSLTQISGVHHLTNKLHLDSFQNALSHPIPRFVQQLHPKSVEGCYSSSRSVDLARLQNLAQRWHGVLSSALPVWRKRTFQPPLVSLTNCRDPRQILSRTQCRLGSRGRRGGSQPPVARHARACMYECRLHACPALPCSVRAVPPHRQLHCILVLAASCGKF